jgi:hypothetical protein
MLEVEQQLLTVHFAKACLYRATPTLSGNVDRALKMAATSAQIILLLAHKQRFEFCGKVLYVCYDACKRSLISHIALKLNKEN